MEGDENGHDFALTEAAFSVSLAGLDGVRFEGRQELLAEIVYIAEQM
jgi:hypothetical protein